MGWIDLSYFCTIYNPCNMGMIREMSFSEPILVFRRWSRKKFAVFTSLGRTVKIGVLCLVYSLVNRMPLVTGQTDSISNKLKITEIKQVEITGHRNQAAFSEVSRLITVIHSDDLEKVGIQSFQDLLEYASSLDVRQRGSEGVQSDVSVRGGSFDHVMILVNGINLSDPQTGHASMDLPIDKECIERIEILQGSTARILGPGAFSGAINIVTKQGNADWVSISQFFGKFGFMRTNLNAAIKRGRFQHFLSAGLSSSNGYEPDTDFKLKNAYYRANYTQDKTEIDFQTGIQEKKFGAAGFYSPRFPNQFEESSLWFASIRASSGEKVRVCPLVYWRQRKDHFLLDRENPDFYENFHLTNIMGSQINFTWRISHILTTVGIDLRSENILSNNLGNDIFKPVPVRGEDGKYYTKSYGRNNFAYFQEHSYSTAKFNIAGGFMVNWNSAYTNKPSIFPGLDLSYLFLPETRAYFSMNRALHLPTFTDRYYSDPVNQGNSLLNPNRMVSFEGGFKHDTRNATASLAFFINRGKDIIDWLWSYEQYRFSPVNLHYYRAYGFETNMLLRFSDPPTVWNPIRTIAVNYIFMDLRKSVSDSVSKYSNLRNKISLVIRHALTKKMAAAWTVSYQDRMGETVQYDNAGSSYYTMPYRPYWLLDGSLNWNFRHFNLYAILSNMLNTKYIDAGSVKQPGRWFKAGISINLGKREVR
jgi:vitamin B12 transporter